MKRTKRTKTEEKKKLKKLKKLKKKRKKKDQGAGKHASSNVNRTRDSTLVTDLHHSHREKLRPPRRAIGKAAIM